MRKFKSRVFGVLMALGMMVSVGASHSHAFSIGFDEYGTGNFQQVDHWVYKTDVGLALDFNPAAPGLHDIEFILQGRVAGFTLDNLDVIFPGIALNTNEVTFVTRFTETVTNVTVDGTKIKADFFSGDLNGGSTIFEMFRDATPDANPNIVSGYNDGNSILKAKMLVQESSFTFDTATNIGTGSFDVKLDVTSYDPLYFDIPVDVLLFRLVSTGTLNQPATIRPTVMWDGTNIADMTAAGRNPQLFKVDGSTDPAVVPEPSTLVLLGFGLLGVGYVARKKSKQ